MLSYVGLMQKYILQYDGNMHTYYVMMADFALNKTRLDVSRQRHHVEIALIGFLL